MNVRLRAAAERARGSLFLLPMLCVLGAVVLGEVLLWIDSRIDVGSDRPPFGLATTVENARAVLVTVAGATISFAGIAFSVVLLVVQLASSQYSPRVVHTLFRDPFNRRVMALVVGTFTYCLIVLRSVRSALDDSGQAVIPEFSVALAVVLGVAAILAIVAFINHNAHSMDVSDILERITDEAIGVINHEWDDEVAPPPPGAVRGERVDDPLIVRFDRTGWVQQIDGHALLRAAPPGALVVLETHPGRYAIVGAPLCQVHAAAGADEDELRSAISSCVGLGDTRTMQQDVAYGLRQLVDVALRALSPGVNDPTTAQDAIFHAAAVLAELLCRTPSPDLFDPEERRTLVWGQQPTHAELVQLAFGEIRLAAAGQPTVCLYMLEAMELVADRLRAGGRLERAALLAVQATRIVESAEHAGLLPADLDTVRVAYRKRFGWHVGSTVQTGVS